MAPKFKPFEGVARRLALVEPILVANPILVADSPENQQEALMEVDMDASTQEMGSPTHNVYYEQVDTLRTMVASWFYKLEPRLRKDHSLMVEIDEATTEMTLFLSWLDGGDMGSQSSTWQNPGRDQESELRFAKLEHVVMNLKSKVDVHDWTGCEAEPEKKDEVDELMEQAVADKPEKPFTCEGFVKEDSEDVDQMFEDLIKSTFSKSTTSTSSSGASSDEPLVRLRGKKKAKAKAKGKARARKPKANDATTEEQKPPTPKAKEVRTQEVDVQPQAKTKAKAKAKQVRTPKTKTKAKAKEVRTQRSLAF